MGAGNIVVANQDGKAVRVQVGSADISLYKSTLLLRIRGRRIRKDGLLGKQQQYFAITIEPEPNHEAIAPTGTR